MPSVQRAGRRAKGGGENGGCAGPSKKSAAAATLPARPPARTHTVTGRASPRLRNGRGFVGDHTHLDGFPSVAQGAFSPRADRASSRFATLLTRASRARPLSIVPHRAPRRARFHPSAAQLQIKTALPAKALCLSVSRKQDEEEEEEHMLCRYCIGGSVA
ncbi:hypothetical protein AAFF_G00341530 [Aldrovandia affinis]|uniref:Uncharacterized protein n=1 Tax=Aldrovandia affinis TaxID=143900 RepID=A0AAD7SL15_9TELE|nr:hypothetical protein AAFF_G00341530 [Aldrovandia affinis]